MVRHAGRVALGSSLTWLLTNEKRIGVVTLTKAKASFSDGYEKYPAFVDCQFSIQPAVPDVIADLLKVTVEFNQVEIG